MNRNIKTQNDVIKNFCVQNRVAYLNLNALLDCDCYTSSGMHLNKHGKELLCSIVLAYLTSLDTPSPKKQNKQQPEKVNETRFKKHIDAPMPENAATPWPKKAYRPNPSTLEHVDRPSTTLTQKSEKNLQSTLEIKDT